MATNDELHRRRANAVPRGVSNLLGVYADHAQNAELWDVEGRRYIDFASGIAVLNTGHVHPRMKAALAQQIEKLTHACFQVTPYEGYIALAERLNALAPGATPKKTIFLSTGAEAVENAVKIARAATGRPAVVVFDGAFHGRTLLAMTMTSKVKPYKAGFGPFAPEVYRAPAPYPYHGVTSDDAIAALEPERVVISPGPGNPDQAGVSLEVIRRLGPTTPILGVCLGHQAIGQAYGGKVIRAREPMHGKLSTIHHTNKSVFKDLPREIEVTRYHSLIVERESLPDCLEITAETDIGEIVGLRHKELPVEGVQFHPESVLTECGKDLLRNFVSGG